ncbi:helix-turn-helix domain-containing protein [Aquimarina algicola]|uniref:Bacteriophage CI repressor n=1 Tax=Aquimarina algicola TaxID=2589995 RepID=A0A504JQC9_9FLAO|nr:helix-turn-helix domain-containing protein [Aquimarina algicola]TPN89049.1 bacteriophage CI repressor [Aquimarina algicola]
MLNTSHFGERIQKLMNYYNVSASSFADYMGVGRSSISHILSGRNKPSLDFVMKVVEAYTDVDLLWLLYGEGSFPKSQKIETIEKQIPIETPPPLLEEEKKIEHDLFSQNTSDKEDENIRSEISNNIPALNINEEQKIEKIIILYSDGTFDSYKMKKK